MKLTIAAMFLVFLGGCTEYNGWIDKDGSYHSVKKICYKNKGCSIQDCVTRFEPEEIKK